MFLLPSFIFPLPLSSFHFPSSFFSFRKLSSSRVRTSRARATDSSTYSGTERGKKATPRLRRERGTRNGGGYSIRGSSFPSCFGVSLIKRGFCAVFFFLLVRSLFRFSIQGRRGPSLLLCYKSCNFFRSGSTLATIHYTSHYYIGHALSH